MIVSIWRFTTPVGQRVLDWPGQPDARGESVPLRLVGGLHALVRWGSLPGLAAHPAQGGCREHPSSSETAARAAIVD
jgi:hypothetical protein